MTAKKEAMPTVENPSGKGWVFKDTHSFVEVFYQLHVFENAVINAAPVKQLITGKIRTVGGSNILWGEEQLTLRLDDNRKVDFICVNFEPECDISSDSGFYL
jgi:hypothetical protein